MDLRHASLHQNLQELCLQTGPDGPAPTGGGGGNSGLQILILQSPVAERLTGFWMFVEIISLSHTHIHTSTHTHLHTHTPLHTHTHPSLLDINQNLSLPPFLLSLCQNSQQFY